MEEFLPININSPEELFQQELVSGERKGWWLLKQASSSVQGVPFLGTEALPAWGKLSPV